MSDLHLWRLALDPARLAAIARAQKIPASDEDHGCTIHALWCALFGKEHAPKPWWFDHRRLVLWAYAPTALDPAAVALADPLYHAAVHWDQSASKAMPVLATNSRVAFDLRACPVVRNGGRDQQRDTEHDYLLWRARRDGVAADTLDARAVYAEWLRERAWKTDAGATLDHAAVSGWSKPMKTGANVWRGRGDGRLRLPDVQFTGTLTITDTTAFAATLARGLGRHRAFGFGMLLLKPVAG